MHEQRAALQGRTRARAVLRPTCAICFRHQQDGVEDLIFILFIQNFALTEVGREFCRGDDAAQLEAFARHILPERLHIVFLPSFHVCALKHQQASLTVGHSTLIAATPFRVNKKKDGKRKINE